MPAQLEVRSEEIQEIMGAVPNRLTRWGSTLVFAILGALLIGAFFFPYPNVIDARVRLTLKHPPHLLNVPEPGTLVGLSAESGALVAAGQVLFTYRQPTGATRVMVAPHAGRLQWLRPLAVGDLAPANEALMALHDTSRQYVATAEIDQDDISGVRPGLPVTIRLNAYPAQEYGSLRGTVFAVSPLPVGSVYRVSVTLPADLRFRHGNAAPQEAVLLGTAQIITQQRRLLAHLFSKS